MKAEIIKVAGKAVLRITAGPTEAAALMEAVGELSDGAKFDVSTSNSGAPTDTEIRLERIVDK